MSKKSSSFSILYVTPLPTPRDLTLPPDRDAYQTLFPTRSCWGEGGEAAPHMSRYNSVCYGLLLGLFRGRVSASDATGDHALADIAPTVVHPTPEGTALARAV